MNKLYMGLLFTSASVFCGCGEYEDTEIQSPQADAEAIGANFPAEVINSTVTPDTKTFDVKMNRINAEGAVSINVKTVENQNDFSAPPTKFDFEAEKTLSKVSIEYDITKCTFQERDTLVLKIDAEGKDHTYGAGYLQTLVDFGVDYTWKDSINTTAKDDYISNGSFPIKIQFAMDFDKKKEKTRSIIRIQDYFKTAGKTTKDGAAHIQFAVNNSDRQNPVLIWNENLGAFGNIKFNKDEIKTGLSAEVNVDGKDKLVELIMKGLSVAVENPSEVMAEPETVNVTYKVEYQLFYKGEDGTSEDYKNPNSPDGNYSTVFTVNFPKVEATE